MYSTRPGYIIGFHGCDEIVRDSVLLGKSDLNHSENKYDWLGNGIYFWENNLQRAYSFAKELKDNPRPGKPSIKKPAVLGAIINLGICLDLLDSEYLDLLKDRHKALENSAKQLNVKLPTNKTGIGTNDIMLRDLDCLVIEYLNLVIEYLNKYASVPFDSVRGVFIEGSNLYPTSGFNEKNHIQVCIRNPNCIKGYFLPRNLNSSYRKV